MSTVQEALAARKKRNQGQIQSALEKSRERRYNKFQKEGADFHDRVNAEIESASKISNTWGANAVADAQANTSENLTRLKALKRELDLYKGFLTEESYKSFDTALSGLGNAYDIYLKNAEIRANFDNEDAYNTWYEGYKAELEEKAKMQKEDLGALQGEVEALQKSREELLASGSDGEAWYEKFGRWLGGGATDTSLPTVGVSPSQTVGVDERITALNDLINQKQDYIQKVEKSQTAANYAALAFRDDFGENSAYKSTRYGDPVSSAWQSGAYTDTGYGDIEYDYINRDPNARSIKDAEAVAYGSTFAGADESFYKEMTPEEVAIFNYIYKTESREAAYAYVDFLRADLDARKRKTEEARWAKEAEESPFLTSIFSSVISPLKAATFVGQVGDYLDDGSIDQNAGYNRFSHINSAIRNEVAGNIDSGVGKFAYQTGMSMADSLMSVGLSGGNSTVSSVIMGTGAAADTIIMAKDRGLSDNQAMGLGIIAGAAEVITEKMSIDALLDATGLKKSVVGYIIKNALTEAGEEATSSTVNLFADILISKDKSEWQMAINEYKEQNPNASDSEAFWHAVRDQALSIGLDALGGLASGGVLGGGGAAIGTAVNKVQQNKVYKQHGQELIESGAVDPLRQLAMEYVATNPGDKSSLELSALASRAGTSKNIGKLSATLEGAIDKQNKAEVENALIDKGIPKRDARKIADYLTGESTSISSKLKATIDSNENIKSIVKDIIENPDSSVNERRGQLFWARLGIDNTNLKNLKTALNPDTESDIIKESEANTDEGEGIYLRDSSERNDGENSEGSVFDLESGTRKNQSRRKAEQFADGEAARLVNEGREVSTADLGVLRGSKNHTVRLLDVDSDPSLMTPLMKKAYTKAKARGLNVKFFVGDNLVIADKDGKLFAARGYTLGNTMLVRADHPYYTAEQITRHEIGHDMIAKGEVDIKAVRKRLKEIASEESVDYIAERYAEAYMGTNLTVDEIWEECICDSLGDMNIFSSYEDAESMKELVGSVKQAATDTTKSPTKTRGSPEEAKDSGKISDAKFSIEFADDIANKQRKYAEDGLSRISSEELEKAIADTAHMVNEMKPYANILPQDKVGKTLVKNGSYDVSVENTTVCIRTLAYNSFVDMVSEKVGRPLTQMESFLVSQKLYEIAKEPQCLYCYVSLDRKAFNEMVIRYTEQRDAAIKAYEDAGKPKIPSEMDAEWSLFKEFLDGRKPTKNMWDRYVGWLNAYNKGETLVSLSDISTEARRLALVENGGEAAAQVKDILKYAQSASWAKKQTQYVAYYDEILKLKPQVIRNLNSHYGMRWYSFSDYSGAFIVENMQQITDAAIRGLKGLSYTKDTDFAEIFAPTGMNINISVYATKTANGYEIDAKQSANIDEAIKLREEYPNVGIVVVATDKGGVEWALAQEWSDVVIPFHTVRTGADVAEFYNWEIFNAEQSDAVTDQNLWDAYVNEVGKKKASKNVYPSEHQNNKDTYLAICEKRGLTPRFKSFLENPNYMKLVNETRQSEGETTPLKAKFDVDAAERSFDKFVEKGGYYEGWYNDGIDVDGEAEIVAEDVRAGRKANEVSYGRQDINFEDVAKGRKTNREHGHTSRELDTIDYIDEQADREGKARVGVKALSNREVLVNALESIAQNEIEQKKLTEYKDNINKMNAESAKLAELKKEIKELTFGKGEKNPERLKAIKEEATKTENRINIYDKKLLSLETASVLKDVLEREKRKAYSRAAQKGREAMHRNVEGRHKTEMRHKINKVAHELDALLNRGTKERNVKKGQSALVRAALDLSDMLFATDDELIVGGIVTELSNREKLAVAEFKVLYDEYHSYDESVTENKERRAELRAQMNEKKKALAEVLERERKRISEAKARGIFTALADEYSALKDSKDSYIALAYKTEVLQFLNSLKESVGENVTLKDMTLAQLEDVYKAFSMVKKAVQDSNKIFRRGKAEDLDKRLGGIYGELDKVKTLRGKTQEWDVELPELIGVPISGLNKFSWNNLRPVDAFERLGSKSLEDLYWDIMQAQGVYGTDVAEVAAKLDEARKKHGYKDWDTKADIGTFKTAEGQEFTLTLREAMSIYAYSKRDQADAHLRDGGFQFEKSAVHKKKGVVLRRKETAHTYRVGDGLRAEIISKLTPAQKSYVDEMQKYITEFGEKGNEVSRILYGMDLFTEEVYFPLFSSKDYISSVKNELGSTVTTASILSQGMTKATKPGANNPIILRGFDDVILEHLDKMSKYHAYAVTIDNLRKVLDSSRENVSGRDVAFRALVREKFGDGAVSYLENYLTDLNGSATMSGAKNPIEGFFGRAKGVAVAANLSVWSQQYFSVIRAAAEINPKYFIPFLGEKYKNPDMRLYAEMKKYAPVTIIKEMGGFDVGSNTALSEYIGYDNAAVTKEKVGKVAQDVFGVGANAMDKLGWITIWAAVKKEVAAKGDYKLGSTEYLKACGERFEQVIAKTQVYDSVNARSGFMRSKHGTVRYLTSFMGEPTVVIGMAQMSIIRLIRNPKSGRAWGSFFANAAAIAMAQAMTSVVKSVVSALRDRDEDEDFKEKYVQALGRNFADDLNPLKYIPVFRDIVSIWEGQDIERPDISLIADAINSLQRLMDSDDDESTADEWLQLALSAANLVGIPLKNIVKDLGGIIRTVQHTGNGYKTMASKHMAEGWGDTQANRYTDLYDAMSIDDKKRLEYYESTYDTEDAYVGALRSSIGDKYKSGEIDRIEARKLLIKYGEYDSNKAYWKLKEWDYVKAHGKDAEWGKYDEFVDAVKTGKNLKAVIKEYTDHGVEKDTLASQITSHYKPLYKKMSGYERTQLKGYLLNAYVLLGYDRAKKSKDIDKWLKD